MRLIDADALKSKIISWLKPIEDEARMVEADNITVSVIMEIEEAPTVDFCEGGNLMTLDVLLRDNTRLRFTLEDVFGRVLGTFDGAAEFKSYIRWYAGRAERAFLDSRIVALRIGPAASVVRIALETHP